MTRAHAFRNLRRSWPGNRMQTSLQDPDPIAKKATTLDSRMRGKDGA